MTNMNVMHRHDYIAAYSPDELSSVQQQEEYDLISMLDNFRYEHLPQHLQVISRHFHKLAEEILTQINLAWLVDGNPVTARGNYWNHQQTMASLQLLLQAKDAAVRAYLLRKQ